MTRWHDVYCLLRNLANATSSEHGTVLLCTLNERCTVLLCTLNEHCTVVYCTSQALSSSTQNSAEAQCFSQSAIFQTWILMSQVKSSFNWNLQPELLKCHYSHRGFQSALRKEAQNLLSVEIEPKITNENWPATIGPKNYASHCKQENSAFSCAKPSLSVDLIFDHNTLILDAHAAALC